MRRLGLAVVLLLLAAARRARPTAGSRRRAPLNIAHQGGEDEFPSNTLYAFRKAVRAGADMLELDIGVTKDGKVIVMHDTTVDGKTNGHGTVASKTLRQIKRLDAAYWFAPRKADHYSHDLPAAAYRFRGIATGGRQGAARASSAADFRVPTLTEVMRAFPHTPINIEIKGRTPDEADLEYVQNAERAGAPAERHAAARPDRRVLQAGGGRPLPRARAADRPGARHRRLRPPGSAMSSPGPGVVAFQVPITFTCSAGRRSRSRPPRTWRAPTARATPGRTGSGTTTRRARPPGAG